MIREEDLKGVILLCVIFLLVTAALVGIQEFDSEYVSVINAAASITLSGLLVWFYSKQVSTAKDQAKSSNEQSKLMNKQAEIMERQQEITQQKYKPNLTYGHWKHVSKEGAHGNQRDLVQLTVHNVGEGDAINCQFGIYCEPVSEFSEEERFNDTDPRFQSIKSRALNHRTNLALQRDEASGAEPQKRVSSGENTDLHGSPSVLVKQSEDGYCHNRKWSSFLDSLNINEGDPIVIAFRVDYSSRLGDDYRDIPLCVVAEYHPEESIEELLHGEGATYYGLQDSNKLIYHEERFEDTSG